MAKQIKRVFQGVPPPPTIELRPEAPEAIAPVEDTWRYPTGEDEANTHGFGMPVMINNQLTYKPKKMAALDGTRAMVAEELRICKALGWI